MRAAQIDPAIKSISGSPMSAHEGKYRTSTAHHVAHVAFGEVYSSPSRAGGTIEANRASSTNSSPSSDQRRAIRSAPTWRGAQDQNFVQQAPSRSDDPFVSSGDGQIANSSSMHSLHSLQSIARSCTDIIRSLCIASLPSR